MQKAVFFFLIILIPLAGCGKKATAGPVIEITENKVTINKTDINGWRLQTILDAINGNPREIKLSTSSYFIFDEYGMVVFEKSSVFEKTERGYANAFNVFFDTSPENKDWPLKPFNGNLTIEGKRIDAKFKLADLSNFKSGWTRSTSMGSEKLENSFIKIYFTFQGENLLYINFAIKD
jgi:hypothetical protein